VRLFKLQTRLKQVGACAVRRGSQECSYHVEVLLRIHNGFSRILELDLYCRDLTLEVRSRDYMNVP